MFLPDALPDDLTCAHTVALVMAAGAGFDWSSTMIEPEPIPYDPECLRAAESLEPARLARFVAEHGAFDRVFAAKLLSEADLLPEAGPAELRAARVSITESPRGRPGQAVGAARSGGGGPGARHPDGVVRAAARHGRPARPDRRGDRHLGSESQHLRDDWSRYGDDAEEIAAELVRIHIRVCVRLDVDPHDLADRLAETVAADSYGSLADLGTEHAALLGPDGMAAYDELRAAHVGW